MAATVKDATRIDDHTRGVNFAGHDALGFDLHTAFRENHAIEAAGDHHAIAFDLSFHLCAFAKDDRLFRDDVAFDVAVDAERSLNCQRALERYALVDEACPFFACATLCGAWPLP